MAVTQPPRQGELNRANSQPEPIGSTAGPAEETGDQVKPKKGTVTCPNCGRAWSVRTDDAGSTIPCLCGFQIEVAS